jgi:cytoskeletal protein CcmA (bactofilin family)
MFARKDSPGTAPLRTGKAPPGLSFLGPEVVVTGDITTSAPLHVEGRIDGNVDCAQLTLGIGGTISGDIVAEEARLCGSVAGRVDVRTLVVESSARLSGDVGYESISVAAGAQVDGRLSRRDPPQEATTSAPDASPQSGVAPDESPSRSAGGVELFPVDGKRAALGG